LIVTSPFAAALAQLKKNAAFPGSVITREHPESLDAFRAGAIKSFEYTYELAVRFMRRGLESMGLSSDEIDQMSFRTLIRTAAEKGLVDDPTAWFLFRDKRNITLHTYDELKALDVLAVIPQFIEKANFLLKTLARLNDAS
jgi:nucleotidyltransferase substrate binding protein (TIGR01987 family)